MESLLDEVDSLIAPGLSTETPDWCSNCQSLRQEIKRLQEEQLQSFGKLKQKIISTDLLIKKYKSKCDDYDFQCKRTEEANKRADKFQRQCEILETQLKAALMDTEPLRKTKMTLEGEIRIKNAEIQSISDRLLAAEGAQKQYEQLTKASSNDIEKLESEKRELLAKIKTLDSKKLSKEISKEYKHEISTLKKEKLAMLKNEKRLEGKLAGALARIEHLTNTIKEKKFSPNCRVRTTSGNRLSPLKSPSRSPKGDHKTSPAGGGQKRTLSAQSAAFQHKEVDHDQGIEMLASDSESSSDDSDGTGSMCSISWTFSPLMKCLSPLPPSPACVRERKLKGQQSLEMEEEGEVSDIADELEQQLLEDSEQEAKSKRNNNRIETLEETNHRTCNKEATSEITQNSSEESRRKLDDNKGVKSELRSSIEVMKEKEKVIENKVCEDKLSVKEKLAQSMEITSPTASRKGIAHQTRVTINKTDSAEQDDETVFDSNPESGVIGSVSKKGKTPQVRRSARIRSLKENETSESELDSSETKQNESGNTNAGKQSKEKSELNRNNTEEFTPALSENTETLSDSEMEEENEIKQANVGGSKQETGNDTSAEIDKMITNEHVPKSDKVEINENEKDLKHNSISSDEIKMEDTKEDIEVWEEEQKVEVTEVKVPLSCLQRKELVNEEPTKLFKDIEMLKTKVGNENVDEQRKGKACIGMFINFQKSSSGTLSNEIEDFNYVDDYQVLTRDDSETRMSFPKTELKRSVKKNLKRRLKRTCKYKDLDSESNTDHREIVPEDQNFDSFAQLRNIPTEKDSGKDFSMEMKTTVDKNVIVGKEKLNKSVNVENKIEKVDGQLDNSETLSRLSVGTGIIDTCHEEESTKTQKQLDSDQSLEKPDKTDITVKNNIESKVDESIAEIVVSVNENTAASQKRTNESEIKIIVDKDSCGVSDVHVDFEVSGLGIGKEKELPARQLSTGFTVNTPSLERASSTESQVSFRNSPSRLFHLEAGHCDTIMEEAVEDIDTDSKTTDDNGSEEIHETGFIFGVDDLLDTGEEKDTIGTNKENASNDTIPFCDKTENAEKVETKILDKSKSSSQSVATFDDEYNRPGCSYHYYEQTKQSTSHEVSILTTCAKSALHEGNIQFESELSRENSLSGSSTPSFSSIDRASPLSPLSISPLIFLDPVSPLPPSPVREIERVSPLSPEMTSDEQKLTTDADEGRSCKVIKHISQEQKSTFEASQPDQVDTEVLKDSASAKLSEKEADTQSQECLIAKNDKLPQKVSDAGDRESLLEEKVSNVGTKLKSSSMKSENNNDETVQKLSSLGKTEGTGNKVQKSTGVSNNAQLNVDNLELFPLPHMISPVRTPNNQSHVKLKAEKMKALAFEKQSENAHSDKTAASNSLKEKSCNEPKRFSTKAPGSALTVKPRVTRSKGSSEIPVPSKEICARKSSSPAMKRVASNAAEISVAKKKFVDNKAIDSKTSAKRTNCDNSKNSDPIKAINSTGSKNTEDAKAELRQMEGNGESMVKGSVDEKGDSNILEELAAGHDNLAFKRKARVAHKPNIQPLKPSKVQIIDAPRLPPVTVGRKRKSLDNINKESQEKKQCKENMFQKQKSVPVDSAVNADDTKKMQAFLKSSESAESFVAKWSTEGDKDGLDLQLLNICLECLGRTKTDTLEVVYKVCESGQYLTFRQQFPFMSDVEKKAVQLFQYICTEMKTATAVVMKRIWDWLFSRDISANIVGKMAQCRVFIALCSIQGDLELARSMFYHLFTCGHQSCTLFIVSVVSVWPEVLKKDPSDRPDMVVSHGMILVFEEIITSMLLSQETAANKKILFILTKLCNWSGTAGDASYILKTLCNRLMTVLDEESEDKTSEVELNKAIELLCTRKNWVWVKEEFIMRYGLQSAANKYLAEKIIKPIPPEYVCAILRLTSYCMNSLSASIKSKDYQLIIKNWLLPVLSHKPGNDNVRQSCLETLLELSPLYITCLDSIQKWFVKERNFVSMDLVARLEEMRLQYKQKFGLQCKPFSKK